MEWVEQLLIGFRLRGLFPDEAVLWKERRFIFHKIRRDGQRCHELKQTAPGHKFHHRFPDNRIGFFTEAEHPHIDGIQSQGVLFALQIVEDRRGIRGRRNVLSAIPNLV